ncbi:hypothetical protein VOLCADRAFT_93489 [Volvox carteri f. nagariensis]|uniref:Secreted protein n=1 Tax=Volvox carteri f. nagariensis TaxID=3068 RepID=D8U292_VOLCA|nr:uncharacterized protein VOLCADRAFT_93489 [Volvox carteri f. nagariensis]EFJ46025.1 hypothetical protein VOLCADRAFT_93489 [Volvox carteri f. nagariensis]|eukprot:XP_002952775.1 hypothetical protein VOLCADRAFT_93489 [Volvox carteri f. nagariensis]
MSHLPTRLLLVVAAAAAAAAAVAAIELRRSRRRRHAIRQTSFGRHVRPTIAVRCYQDAQRLLHVAGASAPPTFNTLLIKRSSTWGGACCPLRTTSVCACVCAGNL